MYKRQGVMRPAQMKYSAPDVRPGVGVNHVKAPLASVGCVLPLVNATAPTPVAAQLVVAGVMGEALPAPGEVSGFVGTAYNATFQLAAVSPAGFTAGMVDVHEMPNVLVVFSCAASLSDDTQNSVGAANS